MCAPATTSVRLEKAFPAAARRATRSAPRADSRVEPKTASYRVCSALKSIYSTVGDDAAWAGISHISQLLHGFPASRGAG